MLLLAGGTLPARADLIQTGGFEDPSPAGTWALFDSEQLGRVGLRQPFGASDRLPVRPGGRGPASTWSWTPTETTATSSWPRVSPPPWGPTTLFALPFRPPATGRHRQNILEVGIGGSDLFDIFQGVAASASGSGLRQTAWTYYTLDFVATSSLTTTPGFRDAGYDDSLGSLLDDVSVIGASAAAPEPGALLLVGSSLGGLALWRRRRKLRFARA